MSEPVRVRFAPSPTGLLHLGNLRSALFDYLLAHHNKGTFVLRLEDTDRERLVPGAVDHLLESLEWLGLDWDEGLNKDGDYGPYVQSGRKPTYLEQAQKLLDSGHAYKDYTTPERLAELRKQAQEAGKPFKFNQDLAQTIPDKSTDPYAIRFKIADGNDVEWDDLVWGRQSWKREVLDDFVAIKSDGYPTYNFAVVVDDHLMKISHVLRGSEFLSTAPKNILVYEALGWEPPKFAHLPPVLGPDKAKLSKRHGAQTALEYKDKGYLPEAVLNYLASLGFNDGSTKEIYTKDELTEAFSLEKIQSSPAIFDPERLDWMNGMHIRQLDTADLMNRAKPFWPEAASNFDADYLTRVLNLVKDRLKFLAELKELTIFFFEDPKLGPPAKPLLRDSKDMIIKTIAVLSESDFTEGDLERLLRGLVEKDGLNTGRLFGAIRLAVTGRTAAPGLFETLSTLGKEPSLRRLQQVADQI